jgi:glycosyltransferase involved in cell wall biosynthesis
MRLFTLARYALSGTPLELGYEYSQELARKIKERVADEWFDILQIEQSHMVHYREAFPRPIDSKCILMFHDIEFAQVARLAELEQRVRRKLRLRLYSRMMRRWEPQMAEEFDRCTVVSEPDRHLLLTANPKLKKVEVIPNGVDTLRYQPLPPVANHPPCFLSAT